MREERNTSAWKRMTLSERENNTEMTNYISYLSIWPNVCKLGTAVLISLTYLHPRKLIQMISTAVLRMKQLTDVVLHRRLQRRERVLMWVNKLLKERQIPDLQTVWRDGSILCSLVEAVVPGSCPRADSNTLTRGQHAVFRHLGIPPAFTDDELQQLTLSLHFERRLLRYLSTIQLVVGRQLSFTLCPESPLDLTLPKQASCIARGMGLLTATQHHRASFYVYLLDMNLGLGDVFVEIQSIEDYGFARISQKQSLLLPRKYFSIPISYVINNNCVRISFIPQNVGLHELIILRKGVHIPGSPFNVPVEKSEVEEIIDNNFNEKKIDKPRKRLRVLLRIVDFVTEKMLLTEEGKLKSLPLRENILPMQNSPALWEKCSISEPWSFDDLDVQPMDGKTRMLELWESYSDSPDSTLDINSDTSSGRSSKLGQDKTNCIGTVRVTCKSINSPNRAISRDVSSSRSMSHESERRQLTPELKEKKTDVTPGEINAKEVKGRYLPTRDNCRASQLSRTKTHVITEQNTLEEDPSPTDLNALLGKSREFKKRCKKIIAVCHFILHTSPRENSLSLLSEAEQMLHGHPVRIDKERELLLHGKCQSITTGPVKLITNSHEQSSSETQCNATSGECDKHGNMTSIDHRTWSFISPNNNNEESNMKSGGVNNVMPDISIQRQTDNVKNYHIMINSGVDEHKPIETVSGSEDRSELVDVNDCINVFENNFFGTERKNEGKSKEYISYNKVTHEISELANTEIKNSIHEEHEKDFETNLYLGTIQKEITASSEQDTSESFKTSENNTLSEVDVNTSIFISQHTTLEPSEYDASIPATKPEEYVDNMFEVTGPASSSSPSTITDVSAAFPDMEDFVSADFTAYMTSETQFHLWPSVISFGDSEDKAIHSNSDTSMLNLDSVISANTLEEALIQLEKKLKRKKLSHYEQCESVISQEDVSGMIYSATGLETIVDNHRDTEQFKAQNNATNGSICCILEGASEDAYKVADKRCVNDFEEESEYFSSRKTEGSNMNSLEGEKSIFLISEEHNNMPEEEDDEIQLLPEDNESNEDNNNSLNSDHACPDNADVTESSNESNGEEGSPFGDGENLGSEFWDSAYLSVDDILNSLKVSPDNRLNDEYKLNPVNQSRNVMLKTDGDYVGKARKEGENTAITGFMGPAEKEIWGFSNEDEEEEDDDDDEVEGDMSRYYPRILTPLLPQMPCIVEEEEHTTSTVSDETIDGNKNVDTFAHQFIAMNMSALVGESSHNPSCSYESGARDNEKQADVSQITGNCDMSNCISNSIKDVYVPDLINKVIVLDTNTDNLEFEGLVDIKHYQNCAEYIKDDREIKNENKQHDGAGEESVSLNLGCEVMTNTIEIVNRKHRESLQAFQNTNEIEIEILGDQAEGDSYHSSDMVQKHVLKPLETGNMHESEHTKAKLVETIKANQGFPSTMNVSLRKQYWDLKLVNQTNVKPVINHEKYIKSNLLIEKDKEDSIDNTKSNANLQKSVDTKRHTIFDTKDMSNDLQRSLITVKDVKHVRLVSEKRRFWDQLSRENNSTSDYDRPIKSPSLHHARRVMVSEDIEDDIVETKFNNTTQKPDWKMDIQKQICSRDLIYRRRSQQIIAMASNPKRNKKIDKEEIRSRFESAKHLFQMLEQNKDDKGKPVIEREESHKWRPKRRRDSIVHSAPSSDTETSLRETPTIRLSAYGGSERIKLSERFHVKDLFKDVSNSTGSGGDFMKGVPYQEAVVKSLQSLSSERPISPYEDAHYCCPHDENETEETLIYHV